MRWLTAGLLALVLCSSGWAEDPEVAVTRAVTDFFAKIAPDSTVDVGHVGEPDDMLGLLMPAYDPYVRVVSEDGTETRADVRVHPERFYVTLYFSFVQESEEAGEVDRKQAVAIGQAFAEAAYPNWSDQMRLNYVRDPGPRSSGRAYYSMAWKAQLDGMDTGDGVYLQISTTGRVLAYWCNVAIPHTFDEVKVPRWRTVKIVRDMIRERSEFDMSQLTIVTDLSLSNCYLRDEGPAWTIHVTRNVPGTWPGRMSLTWIVDARTGEVTLGRNHEYARMFYLKEWSTETDG